MEPFFEGGFPWGVGFLSPNPLPCNQTKESQLGQAQEKKNPAGNKLAVTRKSWPFKVKPRSAGARSLLRLESRSLEAAAQCGQVAALA